MAAGHHHTLNNRTWLANDSQPCMAADRRQNSIHNIIEDPIKPNPYINGIKCCKLCISKRPKILRLSRSMEHSKFSVPKVFGLCLQITFQEIHTSLLEPTRWQDHRRSIAKGKQSFLVTLCSEVLSSFIFQKVHTLKSQDFGSDDTPLS